jgi:alpha-ribazole phosphatase
MTKLILIRHGQTVWNKELKYQGHSDVALTAAGSEQATLVAQRLAGEEIAAVYASDLSRAFITAQAIAKSRKLQVMPITDLREINFGQWEGLTYEQINARWPDILSKWYFSPDEVNIPGGESFRELKERAMRVINELVARHPKQTIVVVSHGGTIRTILCAALNIHLNYVWNIQQDNTAVNIIKYYRDRPVVTLMNDTHHLALYNKTHDSE